MAGFQFDADDVIVSAKCTVTRPPGGLDLTPWPLLVCAPAVWGEGIRLEDNGTSVKDIADAAGSHPIIDVLTLTELANRFGTTNAHIEQALRYAQAHPTSTQDPA